MLGFGTPPELVAGNLRAFGHGFQLGPHDRGMDAAIELLLRKAAIGAGNDVLAAHDAGKPEDTFSHEFWMLHDVCAVADDARGQDFAFRQLDVLPDAPFVFVARIGGFDEIGAGADFENEIDDFP